MPAVPAARAIAAPLLALLASTALAQLRERTVGRVATQDGEPWAHARVELISRPIPDDDRFGRADVLQSQSYAEGRIGLPLLTGRSYLAWAHVELPDGRYLASFAANDVRAGQPFELLADAPRPYARVRIDGLEPWRALGAITCTLLARDGTLLAVPCQEKKGLVVLPAMPLRRAALEIRCGEQPLTQWPEEVDLGSPDEVSLMVLPPQEVQFRCVDKDGRPVPGAAFIATDVEGRLAQATLAVSDALGQLNVRLPLSLKFENVRFPARVQAKDHAPHSTLHSLDLRSGDTADMPLQPIVLAPGTSLFGRVTVGNEPLAGLELQLGTYMRFLGNPGMEPDLQRLALRTDPAGSFDVAIEPGTPAWIAAFLPAQVLARLPQPLGYRLSPMALIATAPRWSQPRQLAYDIDLAQLVTLDVQALGGDDKPCEAAHVAILPDGLRTHVALAGITDRGAGVRFLVARDLQFTLCAWNDTAAAMVQLSGAAIEGALRLRLEDRPRLHGKVVDATGRPLPFAELDWEVSPGRDGPGSEFHACLGGHLRVRADALGTFSVSLYPGLDYDLASVDTAVDQCRPRVPGIECGTELPQELVVRVPDRQ